MTTVAEMLNLCLLDSGVSAKGQVPSAEDTQNALRRLNMMLAQWARRRWLVYHLINVSCTMTGAQSYTLGPGMDFDTPRIDSIESAFMRQLYPTNGLAQQIDYPLTIIRAREDYDRITLKAMQASPSWAVFYDSGWPTGTVYPLPVPNSNYALHLSLKAILQNVGSVSETLNLPPEYEQAVWSNLVVMLCAAYKLPLDPGMRGIAKASLETLRTSNAQIPTLKLPNTVKSRPRGGYSIWSDSYPPGY